MQEPRPISPAANHEELFIQRYQWLMRWALRMTDGDREQAQDLVHDTFVQFVINRPPLEAIQRNIEGYLYAMLRNMHVSQARRAARIRETTSSLSRLLSLSETDSLESELSKVEEGTQAEVQNQLCRICQYAILRKDSSKVGSTVLLRFFHGYYPSEIAQVLRSSRSGVDNLLQRARAEAGVYLKDPRSLTFIKESKAGKVPQIRFGQPPEDLLRELRHFIFLSRSGECPNARDLEELYRSEEADKSDRDHQLIPHIVTCAVCLDEVNKLLGLPLLSSRHPATMTEKEKRKRDKGNGNQGGGPGVSGEDLVSARRRVREVLDHRPQELRVSVNGFILASHAINSELNKLSISAKGEEKVGFVEVFSEHEVRLLFSVIEPPPDGPVQHRQRVELSEGRTLELLVDFSESWPALQIVYNDPTFVTAENRVLSDVAAEPSVTSETEIKRGSLTSLWARSRSWIDARLNSLDWSMLLRPGSVTAIFGVLLIALLLFISLRRTPITTITATELIQQSIDAEQAQAARTDQVLHRTINVEERNSTGMVMASRRVEVWHGAERGITVRRLYDERGTLIAGDWRRRDGVQTLYQHGARPRLQIAPEKNVNLFLNLDNAWRLDLSAKEFISLIGVADSALVQETSASYLLSYSARNEDFANRLIKATITLSRTDLHATEQTVVVREGDSIREYRFTEASFERQSPASVAPKVFEPEPELLSLVKPETRNPKLETASLLALSPLPPAIATADLEVEALRLLHQAGADLGEQVSVTRTPEGRLRIQGLLESDKRKAELLSGLSSLASNPAVRIEIQTVSEALASTSGRSAPTSTKVETVEATNNVFPAYADLRARFSDEEARALAIRMAKRSRNAMNHAWALKRLLNQFSADDLRNLTPEARAKWLSLIRSHAASFEQATRSLRQELQAIFFSSGYGDARTESEIVDDATLARAVERLFETSAANDRAISSAFTISTQGGGSAAVRSSQFFQGLVSAESLAAKIQSVRK
jgi:RNA polymerase sigma factor (sigma-70 family)